MNRHFYAFQYADGLKTTCGQSNQFTGRLSIAGQLHIFRSKGARALWIEAGNKRHAINYKDVRFLHLGMNICILEEYLTELKEGLE